MPQRLLPPKVRGEIAELAFLHKAASLGLTVSLPYGDSARFDVITVGGSRVSRLQIKCATLLSDRGYFTVNAGHSPSGRFQRYTAAQIDFLVGYIQPEDTWYFFPPSLFAGSCLIRVYPRGSALYPRYEEWRGRWDLLFDTPPPGLTLHASAEPEYSAAPLGNHTLVPHSLSHHSLPHHSPPHFLVIPSEARDPYSR
jgi:hypothetical protein